MIGTIWQRYIFKNLLKGFFFFLFCFFFLYTLIDFSTHSQDFIFSGKIQFSKISSYYTYQFLKRIPLLLPLSLLISSIFMLNSLNTNRELVALQSSGIKLKKILRPFFLLAAFCSLLCYANEEIFMPISTANFDKTKHPETKNPLKNIKKKQFSILYLNDSSKLVYQRLDKEKNAFFDVYWIRSFQDIWRMKYLNATPENPTGEYVDHIIRNKEGFLEKVESHEKHFFPLLKWDSSQLNQKQAAIKHQKISSLALLTLKNEKNSFHFQGEIKTQFLYKLAMPLLSFILLFGVIPFCVRYSRTPPLFMIYGISIFCFVVFFILMNAMIIIGENQVIPPYAAILSPFFFCFVVTYQKFYRLT